MQTPPVLPGTVLTFHSLRGNAPGPAAVRPRRDDRRGFDALGAETGAPDEPVDLDESAAGAPADAAGTGGRTAQNGGVFCLRLLGCCCCRRSFLFDRVDFRVCVAYQAHVLSFLGSRL